MYFSTSSKLDYQASSPDEKALVEVCARMGLVYVGEDNDIMNIRLKTRCVKVSIKEKRGRVQKGSINSRLIPLRRRKQIRWTATKPRNK